MDFQLLFKDFQKSLFEYDKPKCIGYALHLLDSDSISIPDLYSQLLVPSLYAITEDSSIKEIPVWAEHVQSGIIRTILELCYPYIMKKAAPNPNHLKAITCCLEEEYHELGAKMASDFLTLIGFDAYFIGANTPKEDIIKALQDLNPEILCISVTNYYHLTKLHSLLLELDNLRLAFDLHFKIVVGGYAIDHTSNVDTTLHPDFFVHTFDDLKIVKEAIL